MRDTIYALSSAPGRSAIAVIRISGPAAHVTANRLGATGLSARYAAVRRLIDPGTAEPLDDALVLRFDAPSSATGEDVVELHVHGGNAVVSGVLEALSKCDNCRPAEPGEFTRRAFENGKLDLTAAEGLVDLIDAETSLQRVQAFSQYEGGLAERYDAWRLKLLEAMALVEAMIDFSDEADVAEKAFEQAVERVDALGNEIGKHLASANRGEIVRSGFRVALAGVPNAGKSSLLNALAARDVAIVSHEAGTTRDVIEVRLDLGGLPVIVSDTAGIREAPGDVELEGIRRARATMANANLVVWLIDPENPVPMPMPMPLPQESFGLERRSSSGEHSETNMELRGGLKIETLQAARFLSVLNKRDVATPDQLSFICRDLEISARTGEGLDELVNRIVTEARAQLEGWRDPPPTTPRHRAHLSAALAHVNAFMTGNRSQAELRAEDLRLAANELGRLTGRIDPEDVLGAIFSRFCIGK